VLFVEHLHRFGGTALETNDVGWGKLQSVYGLLRSLGAGAGVAWGAHSAVALAAAAAVALAWTRPLPYALKAALVSVATLVVTPYVFIYDLVALAVPVAFVVTDGMRTGFLRGERSALVLLALASLLILPLGQVLPLGQSKGLILIVCTLSFVILRIWRTQQEVRTSDAALRPEPI
jgi:arabinofuranan 3-O-arabinosyltransferase